MQVDVLIASCCTPKEVQDKIVSIIEGMKAEVPSLTWSLIDSSAPEVAIKYRAPITPAIFIDGRLEFVGYPRMKELETKIREHKRQVVATHP